MSRRTAILVANSHYSDATFSNLFAPVDEARALRTLLRDPEVGAFDQAELVENESKSGVERALDTLLREAAEDDLVVVYFSGHGELSRSGRLYLAVSNSEAARLPSTAVSASWLRDLLDECDAASVVILLDCCYGGAYYIDNTKSTSDVRVDEKLKAGSGRYVITATTAIQQAEDGRAGGPDQGSGGSSRSVFTAVILYGLSTGAADVSGLGKITPDDLGRYVRNEVPTRTTWQTPMVSGTVKDDVFLARVRNSTYRPISYDDRDWVRLGSLLGDLTEADEMPLCAVEWRRRGLLIVPIGRAFRPGSPPGEAVVLDLAGPAGHVTLVGRAGSGKSTLLRSLIGAVALTHTPDEAAFYCLESGGNRLGSLRRVPHLRRVAGDDEKATVASVLHEVKETIVRRKQLFRDHDLDSPDALRARRHKLPDGPHPDIFLVVDRWRDFSEDFGEGSSGGVSGISREVRAIANSGMEYGVHVVLSARRWADLPADVVDLAHTQIQFSLSHDDRAPHARAGEPAAQPPSDRPGWGTIGSVVFRAAVPSLESEPSPDEAASRPYLDDGGGALAARLAQDWGSGEADSGEWPPPAGQPGLSGTHDLLDLLGESVDRAGSWHTSPAGGSGGEDGAGGGGRG